MPNLVVFIMLLLIPITGFSEEPLTVLKATQEVCLSGYTRSDTTVTISSEVSGRALQVNYDIGDIIDGRPLVEIDPTFINFQIQQTHHDIALVTVEQKKSDSRISFLQKEFHRVEDLFVDNRAPEVKKDAVAEDLSQAKLAGERLAVQKRLLDTRLAEMKERLQRHRINGPEGWHVIEKLVEPGEVIHPGEPLMRLADYGRLAVQLSVSNSELNALQSMANPFPVDAGGMPARAEIHWINPEFNETTRKLFIELRLTDYNGKHRGGILCKIPVMINIDGFQIPKAAVTNRYDNPRVTLQSSGETINVMILSEVNDHIVIAKDKRLEIGMALMPAK